MFCTCLNEQDAQQKPDDEIFSHHYLWRLQRYVGTQNFSEYEGMDVMGVMTVPPINQLDKFLTNGVILLALNEGNCFDFPYEPVEGDQLTINYQNDNEYLSFIYTQAQWQLAYYDHFTDKTERINQGKLKVVMSDD